jgi:uroporphyrinogen-III synthase
LLASHSFLPVQRSAPEDKRQSFSELLASNDYLRLTRCRIAASVIYMHMDEGLLRVEDPAIGFLHQISSRMAAADPLHEVLQRIVDFATAVVKCDSCFVYVLESKELVLRASKNPHPEVVDRLKIQVGQGITGWVAEHLEPVAVASHAFQDSRFRSFNELPEDRYEAFLSVPVISHNKLVGVINLQHRQPHVHTQSEIQLISTIGFLVGAEIERARLEEENSQLSEELESRKIIERGKGILQRDLRLSEEEAYLMLQKQSRQRRMSMREVAEAIILSEEIKRAQGKTAPS